MHIFFSGIGGTGIGPLAMIAKQAGFEVSGSDKRDSQYIHYLQEHGIKDIFIGQTHEAIEKWHTEKPIDWYVYSSALPKENPDHPELRFVEDHTIKHSKRDLFLNYLIKERQLKLVAPAGTHGKTTVTAMLVWMFKSLEIPLSYSVGGKLSFGDMGQFDASSEYFVLECDEFDRNFLSFSPYMAVITGIAYDHHEIYETEEAYNGAFREFLGKSAWRFIWQSDLNRLNSEADASYMVINDTDQSIAGIPLLGEVNRKNAWLVINVMQKLTGRPVDELLGHMSKFPGVSRRMEKISKHIYSDYAHTPEKITGAIGIAREVAAREKRDLVIVYEPLTNRRMHYTREQHRDLFNGIKHLYWVPSYLAREDPNLPVLTPTELITNLNPETQAIAEPAELNKDLKKKLKKHLRHGGLVVALSGGGGESLDEWLRKEF
jgi:UDP-N-acetylmuramate--alanine ligase